MIRVCYRNSFVITRANPELLDRPPVAIANVTPGERETTGPAAELLRGKQLRADPRLYTVTVTAMAFLAAGPSESSARAVSVLAYAILAAARLYGDN